MAQESAGSNGLSVERALTLLTGTDGGFEPGQLLHRGPAATSYLVSRGADRFVLRIDTPLAGSLGLDRAGELEILQAASTAGFAPEPVAARPELGLMLTGFVDGRPWDANDSGRRGQLRRLAVLLRSLHRLEPAGPRLSLRRAADRYAALAGNAAPAGCRDEIDILLRRIAQPDRPQCLCHNDVHPGNLVIGARLALLDWEYAGIGDPDYDIAVTIRHLQLAGAALDCFLDNYAGAAAGDLRRRLVRTTALYDRILLLWLAAVETAVGLPAEQRRQRASLETGLAGRPLP